METKAAEFLPFLGPIGGPEIIMILVVLSFLSAPLIGVIILIKILLKPKPPALPPACGNSASENREPETY